MGRATVLCLALLSVFLFPGNAWSYQISGSVWSTDALQYAKNPTQSVPAVPADATFTLTGDINFNNQGQANISFADFIPKATWSVPAGSSWEETNGMYGANDLSDGQAGVFFSFSWEIPLTDSPLPLTILHDDGIYFFMPIKTEIFLSDTNQAAAVKASPFVLVTPGPPGGYTVTLNYGAINDPDPDVLVFSTPEPGSMFLLALGLVSIGVFRRKK